MCLKAQILNNFVHYNRVLFVIITKKMYAKIDWNQPIEFISFAITGC